MLHFPSFHIAHFSNNEVTRKLTAGLKTLKGIKKGEEDKVVREKLLQTASFIIWPLASHSARLGYTMKVELPTPKLLCPPEQHPLYCLWSFSTNLFHLPVSATVFLSFVYNIVSNAS